MDIERDLSICLVMESEHAVLRRFLHALEDNADPVSYEVIAVSNGSRTAAAERFSAEFRDVILFETDVTGKPAALRNHAARIASGRYLLFCSDSCVIMPDSLQQLLRFMDDTPEIGIIGPRIVDQAGTVLPSTRTFPSLATLALQHSHLGKLMPSSRCLKKHLMIEWDHFLSCEVDWLIGSFLVMRRELTGDIGLFDEDFFTFYAEADLCLRARLAGWHVHYLASAVVQHNSSEIYGPLHSMPNPPEHMFSDCIRFLLKKWTKPSKLLKAS